MQVEKLKTIDADTLLSTPMRKTLFVVNGLIPQGLSVLSGSSKIGKSWLMLWLGIQVARGQPVWEFETHKSDVLYLCLRILTQEYKAACIKSPMKRRLNFALPQRVFKSAPVWNSKSNSIFPTFRKQSLSLSTPFKRFEIQKAPAEKTECMQATTTMYRR